MSNHRADNAENQDKFPALCREESTSVTARRQALISTLQDDDDASGIMEYHLPMSSLQSTDSENVPFVDEKRAAVGFDVVAGTKEDLLPQEKFTNQGRTEESNQNCHDQETIAVASQQVDTGDHTARMYGKDTSGGNRTDQSKPSPSESQPGAFRAGGIDDPSNSFQRQVSEESIVMEDFPPCVQPRNETEILVKAELVSNSEDLTTLPKGAFVQGVPLEVFENSSPSVVEFVGSNRKVQFCLLAAVFVVVAIVASLITTLDQDVQFPSTPSPTTQEMTFIFQILELKLSPVSMMRLQDDTSPQSKAVSWLREDIDLLFYTEERVLQRYAMATFYHATGGPITWITTSGWLGADHECSWFTASYQPSNICQNGTLLHLNLMGNGLGGWLPDDIFLLTGLVDITLDLNAIAGHIPDAELKKLSHLEILSIHANLLSGTIPTEIGLLTSLKEISLANNGLDGTLPSEIGLLKSAQEINAFRNFLSGTIPTEFGELSNVEQLMLWRNELSGPIPSEVGAMFSLTDFSLHTNQLNSSLPTELGKLDHVEIFELQRNNFTGIIPLELNECMHLSYFNICANNFTGKIPMFVASNMTFLSLYSNSFSGTIPSDIGMLASLEELFIDDNLLSGTLPSELGLLTELQNFWAVGNHIRGNLPPEICNLKAVGGTNLRFDCEALKCFCDATM